jgi:hypothetical protein
MLGAVTAAVAATVLGVAVAFVPPEGSATSTAIAAHAMSVHVPDGVLSDVMPFEWMPTSPTMGWAYPTS